jgi:hypothetical protein
MQYESNSSTPNVNGPRPRRAPGKILIALLTVALIASSCAGGSGTEEPSVGETTTEPDAKDDEVLSGNQGGSGDTTSGRITAVWVPSSVGLADFVEIALEEAGIEVLVIEDKAVYSATEAMATAALRDGQAALVPSTIGARLVEAGATVHATLFESDDPTEATSQLGLWLVADLTANNEAATTRAEELVVDLAQTSTTSAHVDAIGETLEFVSDEADALADSKRQSLVFDTTGAIVEELAGAYGRRAGASVGIRTVAKVAGPVASVLDFLWTMRDFTIKAMDAIDAESQARISAYDQGMTAVAMLSDAHTRLCALEAPIITGELSQTNAEEIIDLMSRAGRRAVTLANATVQQLEDFGDDTNAAQIAQLVEARDDQLQKKLVEMLRLVRDRAAEPAVVIVSEPVTSILSPVISKASTDSEIAKALDGIFSPPNPANETTHSNGLLKSTSDGETDIFRHGQLWVATSPGGPGLNTLFPCGTGDGVTVVCGDSPADTGVFTVVVAEYGAAVPLGPTDKLYQYGFVFDTTGDPADNYLAGPSFPNDVFDNTDTWYEVNGGPGGLSLKVTDASTFASLPSGARAAMRGSAIAVFIPQDEIGGGPDHPAVPYRATAFWHLGDFGINPPNEYNLDADPPVHQPLFLPSEIVKLDGPSSAGGPPFDPARIDGTRNALASGFAMFTPQTPAADDPSVLAEEDACWANQWFADEPTQLGERRLSFAYDTSLIDIRITEHDSDSAARGSARFRNFGESVRCRHALLTSATGSVDLVDMTIFESNHGSFVRTDLDLGGSPLQSSSGAFNHGQVTIRFSVTGSGDTTMVTDEVIRVVDDYLTTTP